jgi:hypothetical protein
LKGEHETRREMSDKAERVDDRLADFTRDRRILLLSLFALVIGCASAFVAYALVWLISVITGLAFFQRYSTEMLSPERTRLRRLEEEHVREQGISFNAT